MAEWQDSQAQRVQSTLEAKQTRLRQIEAQYIRTKQYLSSPEWGAKRDEILLRIARALASYDPTLKAGQDATTAVFVLGQAKQIMLELQEISDVIVEFESLQAEIRRYQERAGA